MPAHRAGPQRFVETVLAPVRDELEIDAATAYAWRCAIRSGLLPSDAGAEVGWFALDALVRARGEDPDRLTARGWIAFGASLGGEVD